MPLINCPECNSMISIHANSCPKCGYNIGVFDCYKNPDSDGYVLRRYCGSDSEVKIPNHITIIGAAAFNDRTSIISVILPEGLESIENSAFKKCTYLQNINLPKSLKHIGNSAFEECGSLRSIEIPSSVTSIGERVFAGCSLLNNILMPESITSIGEEAFAGCIFLANVTIPSSVTSIGKDAFKQCSSLKSIKIPAKVTIIGKDAFEQCSSLTSIKIPKSVTSIENGVFYECGSLTSINIPKGVTLIGNYAFGECRSLTSITIPESITSIGEEAFAECKSLASIIIPASVKSISKRAFAGCSSLTSITMSGTTMLGDDVFLNCSSLADLYFEGTKSQLSYSARCFKGDLYIQKNLIADLYNNHKLSLNVHFKDKDNDVANIEVEKKNCNSPKQQKTELTLSDLSKKEYTIIIPEGKKELTEKLFHSLNKQKKLYVKNLVISNSIKKISMDFLFPDLTDYNFEKYEFTQEEKEMFADYFDNDSDPECLYILIDNIYFNGSIDEWESLDKTNFDDEGWFFNLYTKDPKGDVILDGNRYKKNKIN